VIDQPEEQIQLFYLKQVYGWFFYKLVACDALSKTEIETESKIVNPIL
jgi:hypothetical protein